MVFGSTIDRAFMLVRNSEWEGAASALDEAYVEDPTLFEANNFHYLRGRVAENQRDWNRALEEFRKIGPENPLYVQAAWHAAKTSVQLRDDETAEEFLKRLPRDFSSDLKLQIAREASDALALEIYQDLASREARLERAKKMGDQNALWSLLRERKDDDVALECAYLVAKSAATARDQMAVAEALVTHRQFDDAVAMYQNTASDPDHAAEARYQIARIHFLRENYSLALETFQAIARDFPGTNWQSDSEYQIASCYWRLGEYRSSESAYLAYISKYGRKAEEGAVRNLVDVYRVLGEDQKALTLLDRTLAKRPSAISRQVLLFSKAKILYTEKRYKDALLIFQQLGRTKLRPAPGGTTAEEVQYFQALCLSKSGNKAGAEAIWRKLAREPFSYYGQRSGDKLGKSEEKSQPDVCSPVDDVNLKSIESDLENIRHPLRSAMDPKTDPVSELVFLGLWDEASYWMDRSARRLSPRTAAEIAYVAGRYHRSVSYADRLSRRESSTLALLYPAGFRQIICQAAATYKVDPLWLHAIIWQESRYNPNAKSGASARGLMQLIPDTAKVVGSEIGIPDLTLDKLYDPAVSIPLGAQLWASLLRELKYPEMALAAYNGGVSNVQRWKNKWPNAPDELELFVADIGFVETKRYVMEVFRARAAYESLN
jgi:soluble lytic murein transglycosylase